MPTVNGKKYPYTEQGKKEAMEAERAQPQGQPQIRRKAMPEGQPPQGQPPQGQPRPPRADDQAESRESPERQQQFQTFLDQIHAIMQDENVARDLMQMGQANTENPVAGMGKMVAMLIIQMDEKVNGEIPEDMILPLAEHVTVMVGDMVGAIIKRDFTEQELSVVGQFAVGELVKEYGVDEESLMSNLQTMPQDAVKKSANQAAKVAGGQPVFGDA